MTDVFTAFFICMMVIFAVAYMLERDKNAALRHNLLVSHMIDLERYELECLSARAQARILPPVPTTSTVGIEWSENEERLLQDNRKQAQEIRERISSDWRKRQ